MEKHQHVQLPHGATTTVAPDCPPSTLAALAAVVEVATSQAEAGCPASAGSRLSATPETDAATHLMRNPAGSFVAVADVEVAEKLERERDALKKAVEAAIIELVPPARPSVCRRILREALGQPPHQIYNTEKTEPIHYTGHVPCSKCGATHWMHGPCPPEND